MIEYNSQILTILFYPFSYTAHTLCPTPKKKKTVASVTLTVIICLDSASDRLHSPFPRQRSPITDNPKSSLWSRNMNCACRNKIGTAQNSEKEEVLMHFIGLAARYKSFLTQNRDQKQLGGNICIKQVFTKASQSLFTPSISYMAQTCRLMDHTFMVPPTLLWGQTEAHNYPRNQEVQDALGLDRYFEKL